MNQLITYIDINICNRKYGNSTLFVNHDTKLIKMSSKREVGNITVITKKLRSLHSTLFHNLIDSTT